MSQESEGREYRGHMLELLIERVADLKKTITAAFAKYDDLAKEVQDLKTDRRVREVEEERDQMEERRQWAEQLEKEREDFERKAGDFDARLGRPEKPEDGAVSLSTRIDQLCRKMDEVQAMQAEVKKWGWRLAAGILLAVLSGQIDTEPMFAVFKATLGLGG